MQKLKHEPAYYETTKFKWRQRIGFGISDYACNLAYLLANTYLLFYYTNCAGLAAGAVGFRFVVTKFIDAFTDYMVGAMIDRTDTKMGRYRPWMLYGAPVLAVGMVLLFSVPTGWSRRCKACMGIRNLRHFLIWLHSGKHSDGTDRIFSVSIRNRAYQDFYNTYCIFKPWITDIFPVRASDGILLLRLQRCNWCSAGYRIP